MSPPPSPPQPQPQTAIPTPNPDPNLSPPKKPQPIPWTHEETLNLIQAYQEKWYSLKRGQLKASQWEEVSITVAARCGFDEPSKSGTQCRHKIEKLRKRYRAERQKSLPSNYHSWIYYPLMDQLERGPLPISAVAPKQHEEKQTPKIDSGVSDGDDDDDDDDEEEVVGLGLNRFNNYRARHDVGNGYLRSSRKRKNYWGVGDGFVESGHDQQENLSKRDDDLSDNDNDNNKGNLMAELAAQMRGFAERFEKIERKKLEVMRENERYKMEMENKRLEMILSSQQKTAKLISNAFASCQTKMKITSDS